MDEQTLFKNACFDGTFDVNRKLNYTSLSFMNNYMFMYHNKA